jgi:hypothetical protein
MEFNFRDSREENKTRIKTEKNEALGGHKWGYFINIEEEKEVLIPGYRLYTSPVTVFLDQNCMECTKRPVKYRTIKEGKFICRPCAHKLDPIIEPDEATGLKYEEPQKVNFNTKRFNQQTSISPFL